MMNPIKKFTTKIDETPIILAHHPLCGNFEDHYFKVKGRSVCIGCFTVYPSAIVAFIIAYVLYPYLDISYIEILMTAIALLILNFLRFAPQLSHKQVIPLNIVLGASLALSILSLLKAPELRTRIYLLILIIVVGSIFAFYKGWRVFQKCKKCQNYSNFPYCKEKKK